MGIDSPTPLPLLNLFDKGPPFSIMAEGVHIDALRTKDWALIGARAFVQTGSLGRNILGQGSLIKQSCRLCIPPSTSSVRWGKSASPSQGQSSSKIYFRCLQSGCKQGKRTGFSIAHPGRCTIGAWHCLCHCFCHCGSDSFSGKLLYSSNFDIVPNTNDSLRVVLVRFVLLPPTSACLRT